MKNHPLTYRAFGYCAILIEWPQRIDSDILEDIQAFKRIIDSSLSRELEESVPAYASLTLFFKQDQEKSKAIEKLKELYNQRIHTNLPGKIWHIPVCYDTSFGIDLEALSDATQLTIEQIIDIHSKNYYLVYFIGFLPGFLYLGGLDKRIHFPRKSVPRLLLKKGSVAIGGSQTGIYPIESPGGWNIIGNTPISLFESTQSIPCFALPGDKIKFDPISTNEYDHISGQIESGTYATKSEKA